MDVDGELPSIAALLQLTGLVSSLSEARRTVKEGGAYLNNERVTDADAVPADDAWLAGGWLVLRRGKRLIAGVREGRGRGSLSGLLGGPTVRSGRVDGRVSGVTCRRFDTGSRRT